MREIWVADSETDPFKAGRVPAPFIWGLYNGTVYHQFTNTDAFVDFVSEMDCIVYAHNGGKFDWHFILHRLQQFDPLMVINGRLAKFKIGAAEFRDSYNILPIALATYQKDDFDYSLMEPEERVKPQNWRKIEKYLRSDCKNLYRVVMDFIDLYGLNLTVAGTAMKQWQKIAAVKAPKTNVSFYDTIAPFYYGGRVECFASGLINSPFKVIDINSAYPHAMMHKHPYGEMHEIGDELPDDIGMLQRSFITLTCIAKGCFPFRGKDGLTFPADETRRTYTITGWEYLAAIETETIADISIIEVITFPLSISFENYVEHFYAMKTAAKKAGDKSGYIFSKLLLTNLYGKFGANPEKYQEFMVVRPQFIDAAEEDGYGFCAEVGPWALVSRPLIDEKARYYNVAVSASITGFVRAYLWQAICQCSGVLYCDTDSIACCDTGALEIDSATLGAWDAEAECDRGGIGGKKLYAFHKKPGTYPKKEKAWKTASKGARLTHDEIMRVAAGETVTYEPENPTFSMRKAPRFISRDIKKSA